MKQTKLKQQAELHQTKRRSWLPGDATNVKEIKQHKLNQPRVQQRKVKHTSVRQKLRQTKLIPMHNVELSVIAVDMIGVCSQMAMLAACTFAGLVTSKASLIK